eukprot:366036-Chlamydomonas_euryale.AAC.9
MPICAHLNPPLPQLLLPSSAPLSALPSSMRSNAAPSPECPPAPPPPCPPCPSRLTASPPPRPPRALPTSPSSTRRVGSSSSSRSEASSTTRTLAPAPPLGPPPGPQWFARSSSGGSTVTRPTLRTVKPRQRLRACVGVGCARGCVRRRRGSTATASVAGQVWTACLESCCTRDTRDHMPSLSRLRLC